MRTWPALVVRGLATTSRPPAGVDAPDTHGAASQRSDEPSQADLLQAALTDLEVMAIHESDADTWRVFFQAPHERDRAAALVAGQFHHLMVESIEVPDEDWAARSQAGIRAVRIGNVVVAPPWDLPDSASPRREGTSPLVVVVIQPSMGFGTGHHATTRLCLAALQQAEPHGRTVIDVGTGSGVLALAASLLGAPAVVGIDDDPDALASARDNLGLNPDARVDLRLGDLNGSVLPPADIVVANLTGGLLTQAAGALQALAGGSGRVILSGFMQQEEAEVLAAYPALRVRDRGQEDEWVCVTLQREGVFE